MKVTLLGVPSLPKTSDLNKLQEDYDVTASQIIALAAIRQCYSYRTALEVLEHESEKYFGNKGVESKRLFKMIITSGHVSTTEHGNYTFAVEGVSRALLAQITRHRHLSFSVQSQRYNKFSSDSRSGGFDYVVPETLKPKQDEHYQKYNNKVDATILFNDLMDNIQNAYDDLVELGIPQEDARAVLPNAATCNLVVSGNLRSWLEFYKKRKPGSGGQLEITQLAEEIRKALENEEEWVSDYFDI